MRLGWNFIPHQVCNHTKWLHETVAEILVRKKDAAYHSLKSKLLKAEIAKWDMSDVEAPEIKDQRKGSEAEEDDDVILAELLDKQSDKDPGECMEDVAYILDDKEASGLKEELQETDSPEAVLGEVIEHSEVVMEVIHEIALENPVKTTKASLTDEGGDNEKTDEHQPQTDDTSLEVAFEKTFYIYNVGDEFQTIKSMATMDDEDQTNVDTYSEDLIEEKPVENPEVSDVTGDEEPAQLPHNAINKTDEDQTKAGNTFLEATIEEESVDFTDSNSEDNTLKPSMKKEPVVSGVCGEEETEKIPDAVINESDADQTKTKTGDTFSETTTKEESFASNFEELKSTATKSTDEDQSETNVPFYETMFEMESVDASFVVDEEKPINSTQVNPKDTDKEEIKTDIYIDTVLQELATSKSSLGAQNGVKYNVEHKVKVDEIKEVKEKDNGEDSHEIESNDDVVHAQIHTGDDGIQSDDENNNNNDKKRHPVNRVDIRHGAMTKESGDQAVKLHEENEKGIT